MKPVIAVKVVINALSARLGGGQTYLRNLLAHLPVQMDLDILIYAPESLRLPQDTRVRRGKILWPVENPLSRAAWERLMLPSILARERADVLFCPGGMILSHVPPGCKTVTMCRNMLPFDARAMARMPSGLQKMRNVILKRVMLRSMARADLTIFVSEYARRFIQALTPIRNPVTIPHGISDAFRTHQTRLTRPAWLPTGDYLLYVSRFDVYKHQVEVASAFAALPAELTRRYKLLFVGELDVTLSRQVREVARCAGLMDRIVVVGPVPYAELPAAYHHATVNLFASSCENCPNILLEALGAGRPVLSSDVLPMPEFGVDAVEYFAPTDPGSLTEALLRVLQDEAHRNHLAHAAARRAMDFDWVETSRLTWQHITGMVPQ